MSFPLSSRLCPLLRSGLVAATVLFAAAPVAAQEPAPPSPDWEIFRLDDLRERRTAAGNPWLEFLRVPDLFSGIYEIKVGGADTQNPHAADEVYYVVAGRATLIVDGERAEVRAGTVVYVAKNVEHRFENVLEDLTVLVFFATPQGG